MLFSSFTFLFLFLPLVLFIYYISNKNCKNYVLLIFSLFFYSYGGPKLLIYMGISIFMNYIWGILINRYRNDNIKDKIILASSISSNLFFLGYFKYTSFILENVGALFGTNFHIQKIVMPIGISFYTFHSLSYLIDIYRGDAEVLLNPFTLMLYISFFPQLIAGPIVRYRTVCNQFYDRKESISKFASGVERFIIGLAKKVLIANSMGLIADQIFSAKLGTLSILDLWLGALGYTFQIYFDFSGYSDMALGLAKMFGFEYPENFNYPYISCSITEFWRRWHISLGTWFRDYVYIPLGGNRVNKFKHLRNIFIVWLLTGLWHGANWTFIAWGLYYGILLTFEKYIIGDYLKKICTPLKHFYTMFFVVIGWVFFRSPNFGYAFSYIKNMFGLGNTQLISDQAMFYIMQYKFELLAAVIFSIPIRTLLEKFRHKINNENIISLSTNIVKPIITIGLFMVTIVYLANATFNPFIYFKF